MTTTTDRPNRQMVFGDDGSSHADAAWEWILSHTWPGWQVEVVTATPPSLHEPTADDLPVVAQWDPPHRRESTPESGIVSVRHVTSAADPRILLGHRRDADLLVIGSRGLSPVRALLLGSTTEWILEQPPAPTAVVRSTAATERAVILSDGSESSRAAIDAFIDMPWARQSEVVVLSVDDGRTDVHATQEETIGKLSAVGINASVEKATGSPTDVILTRLEQSRPQLVVLGTRGLTGFKRLRLGSTASAVIRHGTCTVMVGRS